MHVFVLECYIHVHKHSILGQENIKDKQNQKFNQPLPYEIESNSS